MAEQHDQYVGTSTVERGYTPSAQRVRSGDGMASEYASDWSAGYSSNPGLPPAVEIRMREAYAASAEKQKDHIAAGLLAVFLGMFGMHKFYLGYNQAAFTMLAVTVVGSIVTFGIAGAVIWILAIVEGLIYLTKSQADFDEIYVKRTRDWF